MRKRWLRFALWTALGTTAACALLAAVAWALADYPDDIRDDAAVQMKIIRGAVKDWHFKHDNYPASLDELVAPPDGGKPFIDGGLSALIDPWGNRYRFSTEGRVTVWTVSPKGERIQWPSQ